MKGITHAHEQVDKSRLLSGSNQRRRPGTPGGGWPVGILLAGLILIIPAREEFPILSRIGYRKRRSRPADAPEESTGGNVDQPPRLG